MGNWEAEVERAAEESRARDVEDSANGSGAWQPTEAAGNADIDDKPPRMSDKDWLHDSPELLVCNVNTKALREATYRALEWAESAHEQPPNLIDPWFCSVYGERLMRLGMLVLLSARAAGLKADSLRDAP